MRASDMFDKAVANSRQYEVKLRAIERELSTRNSEELQLQSEIMSAIGKFAALQVTHNPDAYNAVTGILAERKTTEQQVRSSLTAVEASIADTMCKVGEARARAETAKADLQRAMADNAELAKLDADRQVAQQAAESAASRRDEILAECAEKLPAYDADPLFSYLVGLRFGTDQYERSGPLLMLDRWIAGLCKFERNFADRATLIAMQQAVTEQSNPDEVRSKEIAASIRKLIADLEKSCGVPAAEASLKAEQEQLRKQKAQANDLHARIEEFVSQTDSYTVRAQKLTTEVLANQSAEKLLALAANTATEEDDVLARKIIAKQQDLRDVRRTIAGLQAQRNQADEVYRRAKSFERALDRDNYNSSSYQYGGGLDMGSLLAGYMAGQMSERAALESLGHYKQDVPQPTYTSTYGSPGSYGSSSNDDDDRIRSNSSGSSFFGSTGDNDSGLFQTTDSI